METKVLTRQELYEMVWKEPRSRIAKRFGIKNTTLKQTCERMHIPLPENGYWSKLKFGKPVVVVKLPDNYDGDNEVSIDSLIQEEKTPKSQQQKIIGEIENKLGLLLSAQKRLTNPHPLIIKTKNKLESHNNSEFIRCTWEMNKSYGGVLNINAGKKQLLRALRIMDKIIKLLIARGHNVVLKENKTYAVIWNEQCEIRLREKFRVSGSKDSWGDRQYERTGILTFEMDSFYYCVNSVTDSPLIPIENKISTIIAKLETWAKDKIEDEIASEKRRKEYEEKQRIKNEIKERKANELANFLDIFGQALRLNQANFMREYVKAVKADALKNGEISDEMKQWLEWANQKIAWYDPLINKQDPLLDEINKRDIIKELLRR